MPGMLKRYFLCWIEDLNKPLLNKNDPVARAKLSVKYRGLVFCDIYNAKELLYTISSGHMEYEKGRKCGWGFLAKPFDYGRTDLDCLEPFHINEDKMIYLIKKTEQPNTNNVHLIYRNGKKTHLKAKRKTNMDR